MRIGTSVSARCFDPLAVSGQPGSQRVHLQLCLDLGGFLPILSVLLYLYASLLNICSSQNTGY